MPRHKASNSGRQGDKPSRQRKPKTGNTKKGDTTVFAVSKLGLNASDISYPVPAVIFTLPLVQLTKDQLLKMKYLVTMTELQTKNTLLLPQYAASLQMATEEKTAVVQPISADVNPGTEEKPPEDEYTRKKKKNYGDMVLWGRNEAGESVPVEEALKGYQYVPNNFRPLGDPKKPLLLHPDDYYHALGAITSPVKEVHSVFGKREFFGGLITMCRKSLQKKLLPVPIHLKQFAEQLISMKTMREMKKVQTSEATKNMFGNYEDPEAIVRDKSRIFKMVLAIHKESHLGNNPVRPKRGLDYTADDRNVITHEIHALLKDMDYHQTIELDENEPRRLGEKNRNTKVPIRNKYGDRVLMDVTGVAKHRDTVNIAMGQKFLKMYATEIDYQTNYTDMQLEVAGNLDIHLEMVGRDDPKQVAKDPYAKESLVVSMQEHLAKKVKTLNHNA
jgi:hypothetical protein